jgi:crossover junction endodeoxyribonuclease RuvC
MKVWGGIDPGNDGCLVLLYENGQIEFHDAPTAIVKSGKRNRTVLVPQEMASRLQDVKGSGLYPGFLHVCVEQVSAMPKQGVSSSFNFGMGYGMWLGILAALRIPYTLVTPNRWKKEMMAGMGKEKEASCVRAAQLFPHASERLQRPKRGGGTVYLDGRGDALLLAALCKKEQP